MPLLDYARHKLFAPLGIDKAEWTPGTNGEAAAASGLRLRARDLARIGQLVLQQGEWPGGRQGRALVLRHWIVQSIQPRVDAWPGRSEEHTSELQSPDHLVCRLLLEKKKTISTK